MTTDNHKMLDLDDLAAKTRELKSQGKRVILCHGVFDLLHIGHIRYFKRARTLGDVLLVTLTPDRYVDKGPQRPAFPESLRLEALASLDCVDFVAVNKWPTAEDTLRLLRPDVYVKGAEFKDLASDPAGKIAQEAAVCEEVGTTLAFAEDIVFSSSNLINRFFSNLPEEIRQYLQLFKQRYSQEDILQTLDRMADLKVLVVGDTIIDDYHYCEAMGKSSKDPILVLKYDSHDLFAGGAAAVANHVAGFASKVTLLSVLGSTDTHEDFLRAQLSPNIEPLFHVKDGACTTLKRRFIDGYSTNKLFEVCFMDPAPLTPEKDQAMAQEITRLAASHDLVLVSDFGHGAIGPACKDAIAALSVPVAVNTQANAGNRGFNTISRYPGASLACIAEHELRLETRSERGAIRPIMEKLAQDLGLSAFAVTRGRLGCALYDRRSGSFVTVPSFATRVTDRVGAGDAFLALAAMSHALQVELELLGFLGSVMGTLAVSVIGNKKAIAKKEARNYIIALLK